MGAMRWFINEQALIGASLEKAGRVLHCGTLKLNSEPSLASYFSSFIEIELRYSPGKSKAYSTQSNNASYLEISRSF